MYMPIRGTQIVLIGQEMYELSAPENEGRVWLQHKVCISVALMKYGCEKHATK